MSPRHLRVDDLRLSDGSLVPQIFPSGTDSLGPLIILVNLWSHRLSQTHRYNTVRSYLFDFMRILACEEIESVDLVRRLRTGVAVQPNAVAVLIRLMSTTCHGETVTLATFERRIASFTSFVEYGFSLFADLGSVDRSLVKDFEMRAARHLRFLRRLKIDREPARGRPTENLSKATIDAILESSRPDSLEASSRLAIKWRNYCICLTAFACWARRAEIALLRVNDVDLTEAAAITIQAGRVGGMERHDGAAIKSAGRAVPIDARLAMAISVYLELYRPILARRDNPSAFLFISSRDGQRLSVKSINAVFGSLRVALAARGTPSIRIHPHAFRKAAANSFIRSFAGAKDLREVIEAMNYLAGWSPTGSMATHYARDAMVERLGHRIRRPDSNVD
ncbi:tyrosine-type recombinase/integrase [Luteibacter sp. NPDC031894]|uniref:tyrosine-type recombinase/integrase n=1 Tax=Luteibacter sp. NPDC031894 TaxID=3390572 RepID=UPI003CFEC762